MICVLAVAKVGCSWTRILHWWWHPLRTVNFIAGECVVYVAAYFSKQCAALLKLHQKGFYTLGDIHSEQSAMSECGRLCCECEHVIDCNQSLTNSTHCYTLETTPEWNALTYTQVNAWFRTALKCPGGYIATANTVDTWHYGYCGYIATVETVDTLPLGQQRSGTMVTCVCCSLPHFSCLLFMKEKNRMLTSLTY